MTHSLAQLRALADAAEKNGQHVYNHPRDSNQWKQNDEWMMAASPDAFIALIARLEHLEQRNADVVAQGVDYFGPATRLCSRAHPHENHSPGCMLREVSAWIRFKNHFGDPLDLRVAMRYADQIDHAATALQKAAPALFYSYAERAPAPVIAQAQAFMVVGEDENLFIAIGAKNAEEFKAAIETTGLLRESEEMDGYEHDTPLQAFVTSSIEDGVKTWDYNASADTPGAQSAMIATAIWVDPDEDLRPTLQLNNAWRSSLLDGRFIARNELGFFRHPDIPELDERADGVKFFEAFGIQCHVSDMDSEVSEADYLRMCGSTGQPANFSDWNPERPTGEGWHLVAVFDHDDGVRAWWLRDANGELDLGTHHA